MIRLSPSTIDRVAACPGSFLAEKALPWVEGDQADEGKLLHAVMNCAAVQDRLDGEQKLSIRICTSAGATLVEEHLSGPTKFVRERRLRCQIGDMEISGVVDFQAWDGYGSHLVIDWKFGREPVDPAEANRQLRAYAVLAARNREDGFATKVVVAVVQPRVELERRISVAVYTPEDLIAAAEEMQALAAQAVNPDAPRNPGPKQCKYCRAGGTDRCPESRETLVALRPPDEVLAPLPTGEELGTLLKKAKVAEAVIGRLRDHAREELAAGREVPGWQLVPGMKVRTLPDTAAVWARLSDFMDPDDFMRLCKVSIGPLQDAVAEVQGWRAKDAKANFTALLGDAVQLEERAAALKEV